MNKEIYSEKFFKSLDDSSSEKRSMYLKYYIPVLKDLCDIHSVLDVGCGIGVLLRSFLSAGVEHVVGIDGYEGGELLQIPHESYIYFDLSKIDTEYNKLDKEISISHFDLAISLEVGEHLSDFCAENLIRLLTSYSDLVMFSAAIPGQCGDGHINEQWPSYWEKLFNKQKYIRIDYFRKLFWDKLDIAGYYRQNIYLYVKEDRVSNYPQIVNFLNSGENEMLPRHIVHPTVYNYSLKHNLEEYRPDRYPRVQLRPENISNAQILLNRSEILSKIPSGGIYAEVGVAYGDFSLEIIKKLSPKKIYCIDIWEVEERWSRFLENMAPYIESGLVEVMKGDSIDMLRRIEDASLDFVYIDAMHDYEHPKKELSLCKNKVKENGYIAGDDYVVINVFEKPIMQYGVVNAVNEFMVKEDYELCYLTIDNLYRTPSYCLRKIRRI